MPTEELTIDELASRNAKARAAKGTTVPPSPEVKAAADAPKTGEPKEFPVASLDKLRSFSQLNKEEAVQIPELEIAVKIRSLTVSQRNRIEAASYDHANGSTDAGEMVMLTFIEGLVEPNLQEDAREWIEGLPDAVIDRVFTRIRIISAMGTEAVEAAQESFRSE